MITLEELEDWLDDIWNIIVGLYISINNAKRLTESKYEYEEDIKRHGFFQYYRYQVKFIMVIQLAKLFTDNKNQKRNFHKLCDCLESRKYGKGIKDQLIKNKETSIVSVFKSRDEILKATEQIRTKLTSHTELIKKIVNARDKIYAHRDPKPKVNVIKIQELQQLINLSDEIINSLRGGLFNTHTDFKRTSDWDIDYVIKGLSENLKLKMDGFKERKKNRGEK